MPWSRSARSASVTKAHSNGMPRRFAHFGNRLDLAGGQRIGIVQQAADQRRLAVIDMADDGDFRRSRGWRRNTRLPSQIPVDAQALERVLGLVIHGPA